MKRTKRKSPKGAKRRVDPDEAPEWTAEMFERADLYRGDKLVRRGRPPSANPKQALKLRIDADVVEHFRGTGIMLHTLLPRAEVEKIADTVVADAAALRASSTTCARS